MPGIIGKKVGMTRIFDERGKAVPVTVIEAGPCPIVQIKTVENDGYKAVQLGFDEKKAINVIKPEASHFEKAGVKPTRIVREFRDFGTSDVKAGDLIKVDSFAEGEKIEVTGWSKGKGFQGVVKRHGFRGGPKTHGQSDRLRAPGSLGQSSYPSRVFKGIRMAGRTGNDRVTLKKRRIVRIVADKNIIMIEGSVPGSVNSLILLKK